MQILVELADLQDAEVGDGTTSVVILAAELLKRANELVKTAIHPTNIISGYRLAMREVCAWGCLGSAWALARPSCARDQHSCGACSLPSVPYLPWCMGLCPMQACKFIEEHLAIRVEKLGKEVLMNAARTSMSSKITG